MLRTTHLRAALSAAVAVSLVAGPVAPTASASHETIRDRHHLLYATVIPDPTDAPYGAAGERFDCLSCHAIGTTPGTDRFRVERDCRGCHDPERHHLLYATPIPNPTDALYAAAGDRYDCFSCHEVDTSSGIAEFRVENDCRVCHGAAGHTIVVVDVKPASKRNSVNLKSRGALAISILGSDDYEVTEIDVSSLLLECEVAPLWSRFRKRRRGYGDLKLKFSIEALRNALGNPEPGQTHEIWITGRFGDGTRFMGSDSFVSRPRARAKGSVGIERGGESTREAWRTLGELLRMQRENQ